MRRQIIKGKSVLFDADMIIKAHEFKVWDAVVSQYEIYTSDYICLNEALYFKKKKSGKLVIRLNDDYAVTGKIQLISADQADIIRLDNDLTAKHIYGSQILDRIHPGEQELLAILNSSKIDGLFLCTGDGAAIIASVVLGFAPLCISLEKLLIDIGIKKKLKYNCEEKHMSRKKAEGISHIRLIK